MRQPKVSVILPIYNAEKYLRQCMDSIVNQTLKELEIICVNDGSVDHSLEIIREYSSRDNRILVIDKPNTGYGNSLNCGLDAASGEYIGIIESDDYAELDMFQRLYDRAAPNDLDVAKAGFFLYFSVPKERNIPYRIAASSQCGTVFCPLTEFQTPREQVEFFNIRPSIWSAIYKTTFLRENSIRVNETPGASYQDTSFIFKVWACAERVSLIEECLLHYRQDNEASSVHAPGKVFCVCDEHEETARFLNSRPDLREKLSGLRVRLMYETYMWNYDRLHESFRREFVLRASSDFSAEKRAGHLERKYFPAYKWGALLLLIDHPEEFYHWCCGEKAKIPEEIGIFLHESFVQKLWRKLAGLRRYLRDQGLPYTMLYAKNELSRRKESVWLQKSQL